MKKKKITVQDIMKLLSSEGKKIKQLRASIQEQGQKFTEALDKERIEREKRLEQEKQEREKREQERLQREQEREKRLEQEKQEYQQRLEQERIEREKEAAQLRKEADKIRKEADKRISELSGTWGKFVAEMIRPNIIDLFRERNIILKSLACNLVGIKDGEEYYEIDMLLAAEDVAVVVEIKSTLRVDDVNEHLERMQKITEIAPYMSTLAGKTIYGAVAGIVIDGDADKYAYRKGFFVLKQKGEMVKIANDKKFKPAVWKIQS